MTPADRRLLRRLTRRRLPPIHPLTGSQFRALVARLSRAGPALENDHEIGVPSGGQDHDGPAAHEGQDSGGPL